VLAADGRSLFNALLFRRGTPHFYAFDLVWLNGRDLRQCSLLRRKAKLQAILPEESGPILFASHVDTIGTSLFAAACEHDLEGIVAKRKDAPYECAERVTSWVKIKNGHYSQIQGRHELFDRRTQRQTPSDRRAPTESTGFPQR
jgi:ATP-dependent DNA ligase